MTTAMTPELALEYLGSLWVDLRGAAVLDATGTRLAGDPVVAVQAARAISASPVGAATRAEASGGVLYAARSATHGLAMLTGPQALEAVVVCDLLAVLDDLAGC